MKILFRFSLIIAVYCIMNVGQNIELTAQNFPCGNPATINYPVRNAHSDVRTCENSVAVHPLYPKIILVASNHNSPYIKVSAFVSTNWGINWSGHTYNGIENGIFDQYSYCDPSAVIDLNGKMYIAYLSNIGGIAIAKSVNNGITWNWNIIPQSTSGDKCYLKIDNSCISPWAGRMYCTWFTGITQPPGNKISYSDDGVNWSVPYDLGSYGGRSGNIVINNNGIVYVVYPKTDGGTYNSLKFFKSENGGLNWISQDDIDINNLASHGGPSMAVNMQNNRLFLVYSRFSTLSGNKDVFIKSSIDNWVGENRVNQIQNGEQTFPWLTCDPELGYLACIYYDTRQNINTYVSISTDLGETWCDKKISTSDGIFGGAGNNDYIGIEFNKGIIYPVWADTREGGSVWKTFISPFEVIPKDLNVQNQVYYGYNLVQSAKSISSTDVTLAIGSNTIFRSTESITLNPGFAMGKSSTFIAELYSCEGLGTENTFAIENYKNINRKTNEIPLEYSLSQNYPNPFNPVTTINYSLKYDSKVTLSIFNILGQLVKVLVNSYESKGFKEILWDGTNENGNQVSSGVYFYKLTARQNAGSLTGDFADQKKLVIIR